MVRIKIVKRSAGLLGNNLQSGGSFYVGKVYQRGRGFGHYSRQNGAGMGNVFRGVWRFLLPYVKQAGKAVGQEGLEAGSRILNNLVQGADLKQTVLQEGQEGVTYWRAKNYKLGNQGEDVENQKPKSFFTEELIGRSVPRVKALKKRNRFDSLGLY
jgi:hypothetical protein